LPEIAKLNKLKQGVGNGDNEYGNHDDALPWLQFTAQTDDSPNRQCDDSYEYDHGADSMTKSNGRRDQAAMPENFVVRLLSRPWRARIARENRAMRRAPVFWMVFLVLGSLLWLTSVGVWTDPAYRLVLMLGVFSWFGYVVRIPRAS
jgi:hypothetical protein